MRRWFTAVLFVVVVQAAWAQQKERFGHEATPVDPANYPIEVHVTGSTVNGSLLYLDAVVAGKKMQLLDVSGVIPGLLHAGDYKARLVRDAEKPSGFFSMTYELLFADGTHLMFEAVSVSA